MNSVRTPGPAPEADAVPAREGQEFAAAYTRLMNTLLALLEDETELVRAGRLAEAAALSVSKSELAGHFLAQTVRLKSDAAAWFRDEPAMLDELQRRHDLFRALLQINLTVLATAHAVAEGLIRGAAGELARKTAPQGYGASGRTVSANGMAPQPLALSRAK